jgi:hypothetical protein
MGSKNAHRQVEVKETVTLWQGDHQICAMSVQMPEFAIGTM